MGLVGTQAHDCPDKFVLLYEGDGKNSYLNCCLVPRTYQRRELFKPFSKERPALKMMSF